MKIFLGLCGRCMDGFESSGRGESRWAQGLVRCLANAGHEIVMAPDMEECSWGICSRPDNVLMLQPYQKRSLYNMVFDLAIFTSWLTEREEAKFINAKKYIWGILGWKTGIMVNGYFNENDYVARYVRNDLDSTPQDIDFIDRVMLLAQPMGKEFKESKFENKRIAWVAKEVFLDEMNDVSSEAAARHMYGIVDACKRTGASLAIFSCHEFDPNKNKKLIKYGIMEKLDEIGDKVIMYDTLKFKQYQEELGKCSVVVPMHFAGSIQESLILGLVPMMYRDNMFSVHPWIRGVCSDMTSDKVAIMQSEADRNIILTSSQISDILFNLLTDRDFFDCYLHRLRPMVLDNLDSSVMRQIDKFLNHKPDSK